MQLERGIEFTREVFRKEPSGMWPPEMAVSQDVARVAAEAGIKWTVADEGVLSRSVSRPVCKGEDRTRAGVPPES